MGASIYVFLSHFCVSLDNVASSLALSAFTAAHIGKGPIQLGQIGLLNLRYCQIHLKNVTQREVIPPSSWQVYLHAT